MVEKIQSFISEHPLLSGGIALIAMFLFVFVLFFPSTSKELSKTQIPSHNDTATKGTDNSGSSSQTKNQPTPWVVGQNEDYIISFPQDWHAVTRAVQGGGTAVTLQPKVLPPDYQLPKVYIEAVPNTQTTIAATISNLSPLGLSQQPTTFKNISATMLSGTLPFTPTKNNPVKSLLHKTYIIFENNGIIYTLSYAENEDKNQQTNEDLMKSILNTIQFNQ